MGQYIIINKENNLFTLKIANKNILKYIKQLLKSNFNFQFTEVENVIENNTILTITNVHDDETFYRHFEVVTLEHLNSIANS